MGIAQCTLVQSIMFLIQALHSTPVMILVGEFKIVQQLKSHLAEKCVANYFPANNGYSSSNCISKYTCSIQEMNDNATSTNLPLMSLFSVQKRRNKGFDAYKQYLFKPQFQPDSGHFPRIFSSWYNYGKSYRIFGGMWLPTYLFANQQVSEAKCCKKGKILLL